MSAKKTLLTTLFVSTIALGSTASFAAQAQESVVSSMLSNMMQNAVTNTSNEIDLQLQKSIIEFGHAISINPDDILLRATSVTITDLAKNADNTDDLNLSEQAND